MFQTLFVRFTPYLGIGGGGEVAPKGLGHNLLMQFSTLGRSQIQLFKPDFFDILAI